MIHDSSILSGNNKDYESIRRIIKERILNKKKKNRDKLYCMDVGRGSLLRNG